MILEFLGANLSDDEPFMVTPWIADGNVLDYIKNHPFCDILDIVSLLFFVTHHDIDSTFHGNRSKKLPQGWSICIRNMLSMVT